jgi:hypothetical protein
MKRGLCFLILIFLIASCTKEVKLDFPDAERKTAISCFFTPDSVFRVFVNQTSAILDDSIYYVQNAQLNLFENGVFFDSLSYDTLGFYASTKAPVIGNSYRIEVVVPDCPAIMASDIIPVKENISSVSFIDSAIFDADGYFAEINVSFPDNGNQSNYYELLLMKRYVDEWGITRNEIISCSSDKITDNVLKNEGLLDYFPSSYVFSDALFNGTTHEMKLFFWRENLVDNSQIIVVFRSLSESFYHYKKTLTLHLNNQQSDIWNGVGEPVPMYSNVNDGYGIFAGYSFDTDTIQLP